MVGNQLQQFRKLGMWLPSPLCILKPQGAGGDSSTLIKGDFQWPQIWSWGFWKALPWLNTGWFFSRHHSHHPWGPCGDTTERKSLSCSKEAGGLGQESPFHMAALIAGVREQDSLLAWNGIAQMKLDNICLKWDALISKQQEEQLKLLSWSLSFWALSKQQKEGGEGKSACAALGDHSPDPALWDLIHFNSVMSPNLPLCGCCKLSVSFTRRFSLLT